MKLTTTQVTFLKMARSGTAPRSTSNKTAKILAAKGLIKHHPMFGWNITGDGLVAIGELSSGSGKESS